MTAKPRQHQSGQVDADSMTRLGGWLFRHRTIIPLPLALLTLLWPSHSESASILVVVGGLGLVALGEGLRLWGVHHIGTISRTRTDRLGPLIASGPFAFVRNPLYIGNMTLWAGLALSARLPWLAPIFVLVLAIEYDAIVRWEERLLVERLGDAYREYAARVPRWMPNPFGRRAPGDSDISATLAVPAAGGFSWRETLFSERGTLIAIALGYVLLWLKSQL
jgi:protein-S-isoprenylcysteine O-methyltransferase Ste14